MAAKIKKPDQSPTSPVSYASAYAARLARQVDQELGSARKATVLRKKKARAARK